MKIAMKKINICSLCGFILTIAVLVFAIGMRILGAYWYRFSINPDYGIVVTMARNIASGKDFPVFFYGQPYMGSLEPCISAFLALIFGGSTFVVCLGTSLTAFLMFLLMRKWAADCGGVIGGATSVLLCAIGPIAFFHYASSPRGGYMLALLLTVFFLREAAVISASHCKSGYVPSVQRFFALGFCAGLVLWNFWLAVPAVCAAGIILICSMRKSIFQWWIIAAGISGAAAGSLPFWFWNILNGWQSFGGGNLTPSAAQAVVSVKLMYFDRIARLMDCAPPRGDGIYPLQLCAMLFLILWSLIAAFIRSKNDGDNVSRWTFCSLSAYAAVFTFVYGISYFGMIPSLRYILTFVPLFAVWAGAGVGRAFVLAGETSSTQRRVMLRVIGFAGIFAVGVLVMNNFKTLSFHRETDGSWRDSAAELLLDAKETGTDGIFGAYILYNLNWAMEDASADGENPPVVCSPKLWRYQPNKDALDAAVNPGVVEDFRGFSTFLKDTCASSDFKMSGKYRFHFNARPSPVKTAVIPVDMFLSITSNVGCENDLMKLLTDANADTFICYSNSPSGEMCNITVKLTEPHSVAGVRLCNTNNDGLLSWGIETAGTDGNFTTESGVHASTGFFWLGTRFYWMDKGFFDERRFKPVKTDTIRLNFNFGKGEGIIRGIEILRVDNNPAMDGSPAE